MLAQLRAGRGRWKADRAFLSVRTRSGWNCWQPDILQEEIILLENILLLLCYCSGGALATCKEGRHGGHHVQADIQRAEETLEGLRQMLAILSNL